MDGEKDVLVRGGTNNVGGEEEGPGQDGRVAEEVGTGYLQCDDASDDVLGQWLGSAEFGNLRRESISF